jgi:hypothetical protein
MRKRYLGLALLVAAIGCGGPKSEPSSTEATTSLQRPTDPTATAGWIANAFVGTRVGPLGIVTDQPFFHFQGYQPGGEEKILALPNPLTQTLKLGDTVVEASKVTDLNQAFDPKTWTLTTTFKLGNAAVKIAQISEPDALKEVVEVSNESDTELIVVSRTEGIGIEGVGSDGSAYAVLLSPSDPKVYVQMEELIVGAESTGVSRRVTGAVERTAIAKKGAPAKFERTVRVEAKAKGFEKPKFSIEIDGPKEDQETVDRLVAYLNMGIPRFGHTGPMGLSSTTYNGHVFWDSDIWMLPAVALMDPARARALAEYRLGTAGQAAKNYQAWVKAQKPTAKGKVGQPKSPANGMKFAWESSVSGKETVPGPSQFQDHITGSVAFGLELANRLGVITSKEFSPVAAGAKAFFQARSEPGPDGLEIKQTMSPDEFHTGDNDLYTNVLAQRFTGEAYKLPKDATSFLTYDGDPLRGYKQAAAVLTIYPLQLEAAERQASVMLERFASKVTENGPAMTDSVHATIAARLGEPDQAYEFWKKGVEPFTDNPLGLFSEKRASEKNYFLTGAGGSLQTVLYGFAGIRVDTKPTSGFGRKPGYVAKLNSGATLTITPSLPKGWKSIKLRNVFWDGKPHEVLVTPTTVTVN